MFKFMVIGSRGASTRTVGSQATSTKHPKSAAAVRLLQVSNNGVSFGGNIVRGKIPLGRGKTKASHGTATASIPPDGDSAKARNRPWLVFKPSSTSIANRSKLDSRDMLKTKG